MLALNKLMFYWIMAVLTINFAMWTLNHNMSGQMSSLKLLSTVIRTIYDFQLTFFTVCHHIFTTNTTNFTLVGTGYGKFGTLLLMLALNKLMFSWIMAVLAVNFATWTLSLNMTGQILSFKLLSTVVRTIYNLQLTFFSVCHHIFTRNTLNLTIVGTG